MKISVKSTRVHLTLAFLAGVLLALANPKFDLTLLGWLAPGLILRASYGAGYKSALRTGYMAGLGYFLVSYYWLLLIPFRWYGVASWLAAGLGLSAYMAFWCVVCRCLLPRRKLPEESQTEAVGFDEMWLALSPWQRVAWPVLCAAAWVAMEMVMGRLFTGFPFVSLGVQQCQFLSLIQMASFTGVYGVSFLVAWFSFSVPGVVALHRAGGKRLFAGLMQGLPPVVVLGCVLFYGMKKLSEPGPDGARLKIALIQPSIPEAVIWDQKEATNRFLKLLEMSRAALAAHPDLLVWPEAAMPEVVGRNLYTQDAIGNLVRPAHVWMVMGVGDTRPKTGATNLGEVERYNSAFLIAPNGDLAGLYDKIHLFVFGEYMPWAREFPFLARLRKARSLTAGTHPLPFRTARPKSRFPVLICYEDCFPDEVRRRVDDDTDFILNITNDGWFGESAAQWQHAVSAYLRAVENGMPLVRCANNGLTCWVDARGRLHDVYFPGSDNVYQAGYKIVEVPLRSTESGHSRTFYNRHGDWFAWGCAGLVVVALAAVRFHK